MPTAEDLVQTDQDEVVIETPVTAVDAFALCADAEPLRRRSGMERLISLWEKGDSEPKLTLNERTDAVNVFRAAHSNGELVRSLRQRMANEARGLWQLVFGGAVAPTSH